MFLEAIANAGFGAATTTEVLVGATAGEDLVSMVALATEEIWTGWLLDIFTNK